MEGQGGGEAQGVADPPPKKKKLQTPQAEMIPLDHVARAYYLFFFNHQPIPLWGSIS
jgi:hypothetical protein